MIWKSWLKHTCKSCSNFKSFCSFLLTLLKQYLIYLNIRKAKKVVVDTPCKLYKSELQGCNQPINSVNVCHAVLVICDNLYVAIDLLGTPMCFFNTQVYISKMLVVMCSSSSWNIGSNKSMICCSWSKIATSHDRLIVAT